MPNQETARSLQEAAAQTSQPPSLEEVRRRTEEIRRAWSPEERRQRAVSESSWELVPWLLGLQPRRSRPAFR
jgi:hypothetical protein